MNKKTEALISAFILMTVGVYGFLFDFLNGMDDLIPNIFNLELPQSKIPDIEGINKPVCGYKFTMNTAWFLFIMLGTIFFLIELFELKSKYLITAIPKMLKYKILLTINEGRILHNEYLLRRINRY